MVLRERVWEFRAIVHRSSGHPPAFPLFAPMAKLYFYYASMNAGKSGC